jgi:hypothetical protein
MNPRTLSGLAAVLAASLTLGGCGAAVRNDGHMFQRWADAVTSIKVSEDDAAAARPQAQAEAPAQASPTPAAAGGAAAMKVELVDALQMPTARAAGLRAAVARVDAQLQGLRALDTPFTADPAPVAVAGPPPATGMVQLASFPDETAARRAWAALKGAHGDALAGLDARFERVDLGARGVWVRLKAGPVVDAAQAERVCAAAADARWCASAWAHARV